MTEAEWLGAIDPNRMVEFFLQGTASDRKLRLFAVACCRRVWDWLSDSRSQCAVHVAEQYADGIATRAELTAAQQAASTAHFELRTNIAPRDHAAHAALHVAVHTTHPLYVRHVAGFAALSHLEPRPLPHTHDETVIAVAPERAAQTVLLGDIFGNPFRPVAYLPEWRTSTAVALAAQMYESRDFSAMPILADALQDAACDNADILAHCRDANQVHVRGCWVVDLVLGKQ